MCDDDDVCMCVVCDVCMCDDDDDDDDMYVCDMCVCARVLSGLSDSNVAKRILLRYSMQRIRSGSVKFVKRILNSDEKKAPRIIQMVRRKRSQTIYIGFGVCS